MRVVAPVEKSKRGRIALSAIGIAVEAPAAVLSFVVAPLTPMALATAGLGRESGPAIPGAEGLLDWRGGKKTSVENRRATCCECERRDRFPRGATKL